MDVILEDAARGRFPPPDGTVRVLGSPPGRADAVAAFTAHYVIAADVSPEQVLAQIPAGDLSAPMNARFLAWLGDRLGAHPGALDLVLAASGTIGEPPVKLIEQRLQYPRVTRAARYRDELAVYTDPEQDCVVILGRGLAHRREISVEVEPDARGAGLARRAVSAARRLIPPEEFVFAQISPGNAASLRAFLAAGFTPIGAEVLFLRPRAS